MLIDSRSLSNNETIETDVCIVGAGIAGISLARELIGQEFRVCLLESGGLRPDKSSQSLFWGENVGHHYYPLDTARICGFGGSSHRWNIDIGDNQLGVRLRPLDEIDFEERDGIPYSGWPFNKAHLNPFYERAQSVCKIGPFSYDVKDWEDPEKTPKLPFVSDRRVKTIIFQFGSRNPFINDYRDEIIQAKNIHTYTFANVVEIETHESSQSINRLRVACLQGSKFWISAKLFILAMGAIETSRLLLLSNGTQSKGLGNQNDLVGRFFMEHPQLWSGKYIPANPDIVNRTALYKIHRVNNVPIRGNLALDEDVIRQEKLANHCLSITPTNFIKKRNIAAGWHVMDMPLLTDIPQRALQSDRGNKQTTRRGVDSTKVLGSAIRRGKIPDDFSKHLGNVIADFDDVAVTAYKNVKGRYGNIYRKFKKVKQTMAFRLNHMTEQLPNPNSRVKLIDERDSLGRNRVCLDWQFTPLDIRSIIRAQELIDNELRLSGLGRLQIELNGETPPPDIHGGWHHMGTTRMNRDPKKGVVDKNCCVHDISNLFIAGPSVFPTGGYANPVLTIVALSLRMADHVKKLVT